MSLKTGALLIWTAVVTLGLCQKEEGLPQVDLGYQVYQASSYNSTSEIYEFSNIRYAQPPVNELRFRLPQPPTGRNEEVGNDASDVFCPQTDLALQLEWLPLQLNFTIANLTGEPFDFQAAVDAAGVENRTEADPLPPDPRVAEDCLFLNVYVPTDVFAEAQDDHRGVDGGGGGGAAVLVWIHPGDFVVGSKDDNYDPAGLIEASQLEDSKGIIFVSINYRLGALGWSAGPLFESEGTTNLGLYDQRLAIEWVRDNIHLFGGDPEKVTIMGQAAGGTSVIYQITAYGGTTPIPFQQAITQSAVTASYLNDTLRDQIYLEFLERLGVETLQEAKELSSEVVIEANKAHLNTIGPYDAIPYAPTVDGDIVPTLSETLLSEVTFNQSIKVMAGHNSNEAFLAADPRVTDDASFAMFIQQGYPSLSRSDVDFLVEELYPAVYDGSQPYDNAFERTVRAASEAEFECSSIYLAQAFPKRIYNYLFAVPPGFHALDIAYTFFPTPTFDLLDNIFPPLNETVAKALQQYITSFTQDGQPRALAGPSWPLRGDIFTELVLNNTDIYIATDSTSNLRCQFWQDAIAA